MTKTRIMMMSLLAAGLFAAGCMSDAAQDPSDDVEDTAAIEQASTHTEPDWYWTCSNDLMVCSPGYGATSWVPDPVCPSGTYKITCTWGKENP